MSHWMARYFFVAVCALGLSAGWGQAAARAEGQREDQDVKQVVAKFESRYRAARTLQATFLERYLENGRLARTEAGVAYFRRPGKMRWEYEEPERNLFLVDGKWAWFYVPADHTVTRAPAKQSSDWRTPLALLAGEMKVSRVCSRVERTAEERPENGQNVILRCVLRGEEGQTGQPARAQNDAVFFEIVRDTGELVRIVARQSGGVAIEFNFANWAMDPVIAEAKFHFEPPMGVAIVNGDEPVGSRAKK
ncbi:MAG TPA: outer membrane lipoprotein carrier protein LolA [Candidatus Saccharimonadales bacterium]|nr:outer membrane lipoprotein carrier protein LolA [Candidatus Saccharimonadales bacterium]